jgi:hypothetical protein
MSAEHKPSPDSSAAFQQEAGAARTGIVAEFWDFLKHSKKWWLLPVIVMMVALGALVALTSTGAGAFIYALF